MLTFFFRMTFLIILVRVFLFSPLVSLPLAANELLPSFFFLDDEATLILRVTKTLGEIGDFEWIDETALCDRLSISKTYTLLLCKKIKMLNAMKVNFISKK